jgi:hypothetical protein
MALYPSRDTSAHHFCHSNSYQAIVTTPGSLCPGSARIREIPTFPAATSVLRWLGRLGSLLAHPLPFGAPGTVKLRRFAELEASTGDSRSTADAHNVRDPDASAGRRLDRCCTRPTSSGSPRTIPTATTEASSAQALADRNRCDQPKMCCASTRSSATPKPGAHGCVLQSGMVDSTTLSRTARTASSSSKGAARSRSITLNLWPNHTKQSSPYKVADGPEEHRLVWISKRDARCPDEILTSPCGTERYRRSDSQSGRLAGGILRGSMAVKS